MFSSIRALTVFRALNRKCGWSCFFRAFSWLICNSLRSFNSWVCFSRIWRALSRATSTTISVQYSMKRLRMAGGSACTAQLRIIGSLKSKSPRQSRMP